MARQPLRPPPHSALLCHGIHRDLAAVRHGHQHGSADLLPRAAGPDRRRPATSGPGGPAGDIPSQAAWLGHGRIRTGHHPRAHPRSHARRLDHRQLLLALDLLSQPSRRHHLGDDDQRLRARPALHRQAQDRRRRSLGHRLSRPRLWHVAGRARYRTAQGLVQQPANPPLGCALRLRPGRAGGARVDGRTSHRGPARPQGPHFRHRHHHHDHAGLRALRQPDAAAHLPADPARLSRTAIRTGALAPRSSARWS